MTRLEKIEARLKAATPGPLLEREDEDYYQAGTYLGVNPYKYSERGGTYFRTDICRVHNDDDKELLKYASDDIRYLLDTVAKLEAALSVSWDAISQSRGQWIHSVNAQTCLNALTTIEAALKGDGNE